MSIVNLFILRSFTGCLKSLNSYFSFESQEVGCYLKWSYSFLLGLNQDLSFSTMVFFPKRSLNAFQSLLIKVNIIVETVEKTITIIRSRMHQGRQFNNNRIKRRPSSRIAADNAEELPPMDFQRKIIELESSITTLRTNVQLKLSKFTDPNIELRSQLDKEVNSNKQLDMRLNQLESSIASMREMARSSSEVDYAAMRELESKVMMLEYKVRSGERTNSMPLALPAIESDIGEMKQNKEIRVLKDIMNQEIKMREKREEFMNRQYDDLFQKMLKLERASYQQKEIIPPLSPSRQNNALDFNYLKDTIESISSKLSAEAITRERKQHSMKQYMDSMVASLRDELLNENKSIIESQIDTTREINESLQALYGTINETKENINRDLETTQSLISENVKILSKRIEIVRDKVSRPGSSEPISEPSEDLKSKIVHSIQMIEQRIVDIESTKKGVSTEAEKRTNSMINELSTNVDEFQESLNAWTKDVETKNISIFKEISSNLKNMKLELNSSKQELTNKLNETNKKVASNEQETVKLKDQLSQMRFDMKEENTKHTAQIRQVRDFVDSGKMELEKLITESLRDMDTRNLKHNHYINQKMIELNSKFEESLFEEVEKLTAKINKQISHIGQVLSQKDKRINNEITIISEALKYNQIRTQGQVSDLQEKSMESYLKLKTDLVELQTHEAKLREKQSERVEISIKTLSESLTKRIDFVTDGTKKALELAILKDKTELTELIEKNRDDCLKAIGTLKYDFTNDIYIRIEDERSEREKSCSYLQSAMQILRDQLDSKLDRYDKQFTKIQAFDIQTHKRDLEIKSTFKGIEENMQILQQQSIYLKDEIKKFTAEVDALSQQNYKMDDKLNKKMDAGLEKLSNQIYVDGLFVKTQFSEQSKTIAQLIKITSSMMESQDENYENQEYD